MRALLPTLLLASAGCSTVLGLDDFQDAPPSGAATGTTASGTGASGGGSSGTAGEGGSGATGGDGGRGGEGSRIDCSAVGVPFVILSHDDVAQQPIEDHFHLVPDPTDGKVHVVAVSGSKVYVVTVKDDTAMPVQTLASFDAMSGGKSRVFGGFLKGQKIRIVGAYVGHDVAYLDFGLDGSGNVDPMQAPMMAVQLGSQPPGCQATGASQVDLRSFIFTLDDGTPHFAATCDDKDANKRYLSIGTEQGFVAVEQGMTGDEALVARGYVVTPTKLLWTGDDFGGSVYFRYGTTAQQLATKHQMKLTSSASDITAVLTLLPAGGQKDGATVFAVRVNTPPVLTPADVYTGEITVGNYSHFDQIPPPELLLRETVDELEDMPLIDRLYPGIEYIPAASVNPTADRILFSYFRTDGTVEIFGQELVVAPQNTVLIRGYAAPINPISTLAAWSEKVGNAFRIMGLRLICD